MKKAIRIFISLTLILFLGFLMDGKEVNLQAEQVKDEREFKAVWMSTFIGEAPYTSEAQFKGLMNNAFTMFEYYGINALIFHVRTHNNAFYPSEFNPRASWWSGVDFDVFDPIEWLIEESHKRGIEFHAWMNPYRVNTGFQSGSVPEINPQNDPSNLIVEGSATILNPAKEVVREHIYNTIDEFINLYPTVDAIHFDDYFYISTSTEPTGENARREEITKLIEGVHDVLTNFNLENNTAIQLGISPTGIYRNGDGNVSYDSNGNPVTNGSNTRGFAHYGDYLYADTLKWSIDGSIDYLIPQTYWARNRAIASFTELASWWDKVFKNLKTNIYLGIGTYMADEDVTDGWVSDMQEMNAQLSIITSKDYVKGYSIYSFKHLENGYNNSAKKSGQQIRNAYSAESRRSVKVLPEINSMTPIIVEAPKNVQFSLDTLSWNKVDNAKFYYIYASSGLLTYSSDEIIGVVGAKDLNNTYDVSSYGSNYTYGVRALSKTNHLSETPDIEQPTVYNINYNLNGGSFGVMSYTNREEMITDFLTDFYNFINPSDISLNDFIHGVGQTSGFDGLYGLLSDDSYPYFNYLYDVDDKTINDQSSKFINQPEYNKWVPLLDLMDEYTNKGQSSQTFWGSTYVGARRIKPFIRQENLWEEDGPAKEIIINEIVERIPVFTEVDSVIYYNYTEYTEDITLPIPVKEGYTFTGWYTSEFGGSKVTVIKKGSTGDFDLYARFTENSLEATLYFDLGYNNLWLPSVTVNKGEILTDIYSPTREGYEFNGWLLNGSLFDFNETINEDLTFVAFWKRSDSSSDHLITFSLGYDDLVYQTVFVANGEIINAPEKPTREGYLFAGWYYGQLRFDFTERIYEDYDLVARWNLKVSVNNKVETINGASIRTEIEGGLQRLRFYGRVDSSLVGGEFGFYAIFGEATPELLLDKIRNSEGGIIYINGRDVKKQAINKVDYKNEFSIVLTGIPKIGYSDKLTVIAYAKDKEGNLYLAEKGTTRSVLEVAVKMEEANDSIFESREIISYAEQNMYKLDYDAYGNLKISSSLYESYRSHIKEIFFKDWNKKFSTDFVDPTANDFFTNAKLGSNDADRNNTNIAGTNIYKFFNDPIYSEKWSWFLDYLTAVDYTIHTAGQIEAIKSNGTYKNPVLNNRQNLYNASHLSYSIYNFFYEANESGSYTAINFTLTTKHPDDNMDKYDRYNKVLDYNDKIYIDVKNHQIFKLNDTIRLPEINKVAGANKTYVYFDGTNYYPELSFYKVKGILTFTYVEVSVNSYSISFYEGEEELLELKDYYLTSEEKELPVLTKQGFDFKGWYVNKNLTGSPVTKINTGSTGAKVFYAKWEQQQALINVFYDFDSYGYHTTTKTDLFLDFRKDYKDFYNLRDPIGSTVHDFYKNSKLTLPNNIQEIFLDPVLGAKWDFIEDYILLKAAETNYIHLSLLEEYNEEIWRLNIQALFTDVLYESDVTNNFSMDFSNLNLNGEFWRYSSYNKHQANYTYANSLVSSDAVKIWHPNYVFVGWADSNNKIITDLSELSAGTHYLKAVYKLK